MFIYRPETIYDLKQEILSNASVSLNVDIFSRNNRLSKEETRSHMIHYHSVDIT